jgi:WD40 repeat protein
MVKTHKEIVLCLVKLNECRLASAGDDKSIKIWQISSGQCLLTLNEHQGSVNFLAVLDERRLASASRSIKFGTV